MTLDFIEDTCNTFVFIEGDIVSLQSVADRINNGNGLKSDIFNSLEFTEDELDISCDWTKSNVENTPDGAYMYFGFYVSEDEEQKDSWEKVDFGHGVYYELHTADRKSHWTNDKDGVFFKKPYHVVVIDDKNSEMLQGDFRTEEEAVQFVKDNSSCIPKELLTLDAINTFCLSKEINTLFEYHKTVANTTCPPIITKIIKCLAEAVNACVVE